MPCTIGTKVENTCLGNVTVTEQNNTSLPYTHTPAVVEEELCLWSTDCGLVHLSGF